MSHRCYRGSSALALAKTRIIMQWYGLCVNALLSWNELCSSRSMHHEILTLYQRSLKHPGLSLALLPGLVVVFKEWAQA